MENPTYIALSRQVALERQMDLLANNIANQSTPGFKSERMMFSEYLERSPDGQSVSYVRDAGTERDMSQGPLTQTGNSLDVALQGPGFLEVQTAAGIRYTRNGRLQLNTQGQLVDDEGDTVLSQGDQPIQVPTGSSGVTIGQDGSIATTQGTIGRLGVVTFADPKQLDAEGSGLYVTNQAPDPATGTKVMQGMIEESNVNPILQMTRLMAAARSIGNAKSFVDGESDRQKNAIDRLGKTV